MEKRIAPAVADLSNLDIRAVNSMTVKPCGDHVLVSVEKEADGNLVGMIIALRDSGPTKKTQIGRVTAVGPGLSYKDMERPITVKPGQRVIFASHIGFPINMGDRGTHLLIKNNDVLGIIEAEESEAV